MPTKSLRILSSVLSLYVNEPPVCALGDQMFTALVPQRGVGLRTAAGRQGVSAQSTRDGGIDLNSKSYHCYLPAKESVSPQTTWESSSRSGSTRGEPLAGQAGNHKSQWRHLNAYPILGTVLNMSLVLSPLILRIVLEPNSDILFMFPIFQMRKLRHREVK